jgi:hypothetical protein
LIIGEVAAQNSSFAEQLTPRAAIDVRRELGAAPEKLCIIFLNFRAIDRS